MDFLLGKQIGEGGTSIVFEWGDNYIVKIYKPGISKEVIEKEEQIAKQLNKYNLPAPKYIKTVELNNQISLVYEKIQGRAFGDKYIELSSWEERARMANLYAKVHYDIHQISINTLPSQRELLIFSITALRKHIFDQADKLLAMLDSIPVMERLCHGDYHPLNIIVASDKLSVLDWNSCCSGNPLIDVAWSCLILASPVIKEMLGSEIASQITDFSDEYLDLYCSISYLNKQDIISCLPIVAAKRLHENLQYESSHAKYENEWLYEIIKDCKAAG